MNSNWRGPIWLPLNYLLIEAIGQLDPGLAADVRERVVRSGRGRLGRDRPVPRVLRWGDRPGAGRRSADGLDGARRQPDPGRLAGGTMRRAASNPLTRDARTHDAGSVTSKPAVSDAAERAGVSPAYVERLVELKVIAAPASWPSVESAVRRVTVVLALDRAGLPLTALGQAMESGALELGFVDQPVYEKFASMVDETFQEASDRSGAPLDLVLTIFGRGWVASRRHRVTECGVTRF